MPREFLRRIMPNPDTIKDNKSLRFLGSLIHDANLWHLNRHSVSRAVAVGLFWAVIPMPMQMLAAALLAILVRANLPLSITLVWITNPITMPPIFYSTYKFGAWMLNTPTVSLPDKVTLRWILEITTVHWQPLYLGSLVAGMILAVIGYTTTMLYWRWWVARNWKRRQRSRQQNTTNTDSF